MIHIGTYYILLILIIGNLGFTTDEAISQTFDCNYYTSSSTTDNSGLYIGRVKPNRTTLSGGVPSPDEAYFPVLIVFVQFQNSVNRSDWPDKNTNGGKPIYLDSLVALPTQYNNPTDWWNAYNERTQIISDHYMELSRGQMQMLGRAYSVVLSKADTMYTNEFDMNQEILDSLTAQDVIWDDYDKWRYDTTDNLFHYEQDKRIDMIFRIVKSIAPCMYDARGYNALGGYDRTYDHTVFRYCVHQSGNRL